MVREGLAEQVESALARRHMSITRNPDDADDPAQDTVLLSCRDFEYSPQDDGGRYRQPFCPVWTAAIPAPSHTYRSSSRSSMSCGHGRTRFRSNVGSPSSLFGSHNCRTSSSSSSPHNASKHVSRSPTSIATSRRACSKESSIRYDHTRTRHRAHRRPAGRPRHDRGAWPRSAPGHQPGHPLPFNDPSWDLGPASRTGTAPTR